MNEINAKAQAAQAKVYALQDETRAFLRAQGGSRTTVDTLNRFDELRAARCTAEAEALKLAIEAVRAR